ncbi:DUF1430 domain-containing protein [Staphylococcus simiae]|uniref:Membrane protein n=1 Tax=Staphylococcus simiae CCM 7213 = CCUG 51256 TaxID=911238 RepID=G5JIC9_9STAP|nr:DUF1430 domain-containing protein [Staphylococcus simiae]EHJ08020.1 membrane protein [Staphylococcus simiae CCM 7213 = CCUG 51256]PNZ14541.1 DUF1430 domain-containing protein [Staphylococcus simiae]SNV57827.1 membrane spanning protein [Staphylococcus simiae]
MKVFKIVLDFIVVLLVALLLFIFSYKESESYIPNAKYIVNINKWNYEHSKTDIFKSIEQFAKQQDISIYKVSPSISKENVDKDIYIFNPLNNIKIQPFNSQLVNHYLTDKALQQRDVLGDYYITSSHFNEQALKDMFQDKGLKAHITKVNTGQIALEVLFDTQLIIPIIAIAMIYVLYYLYDKNRNFKQYAIQSLHGYQLHQLIAQGFIRKSGYWLIMIMSQLLVTIVTLILTTFNGNLLVFLQRLIVLDMILILFVIVAYIWSAILLLNLNIASMIKGKQHFKTMRTINTIAKCILLVLLAFVITQNIHIMSDLQKVKATEQYWHVVDDYYAVELAPILEDEAAMKSSMANIHKLIQDNERYGNALLIKTKSFLASSPHNYSPFDGNVTFVNPQFWKLYNQKYPLNIPLNDRPQRVEAMIPANHKADWHTIKAEYQEWYLDLKAKNINKGSIQVTKVKQPTDLFSFEYRTVDYFKKVKSSAIINVTADDLWDDFYYATLSQGGYLFKDYDAVNDSIKKYNLQNKISGVTKVQDIIERDYRQNQLQLVVLSSSMVFLIIVMIAVVLFDVKIYFEQHNKVIVMKKLFGYKLAHIHYRYVLLSNLLLIIVWGITYNIINSPYLSWLFLTTLVIQLFLQCIYMRYLEKYFNKVIREL